MLTVKSSKGASMGRVKLLVYGAAGVGKTVLCSTAPNPIIISAERGLLSIADKDIDVLEITSISELQQALNIARKGDWETICLDSISEIAEVVLAEYKALVNDGRQAYGQLSDEMSKIIRQFRDLDAHVVLTAKESREDKYSHPSMPGKTLTGALPYFFDLVLYMKSTKENRVLHTRDNFTFNAKDRSGKLDDKEAPNLNDIFKKVSSNG
jgi:hypothetical protein